MPVRGAPARSVGRADPLKGAIFAVSSIYSSQHVPHDSGNKYAVLRTPALHPECVLLHRCLAEPLLHGPHRPRLTGAQKAESPTRRPALCFESLLDTAAH